MSIILTDRWFEIPQVAQVHATQTKLKDDLTEKKYHSYSIAAGRRSFKTERFCKRFAVLEATKNKGWEIHLGAPTRIQAKEILWEDIKKLVPPYLMKRRPSESELKIELINGTKIHIIGLQEFKRVHGGRSNLAIATEYQDCDPAVYSESFQPMLNDTGGIWIEEGRPFGKNHFFDDYMRGLNGEEGWGSYHWKSSDILSEEQIRQAQQDLALKDYQREYDASFETEFGAPYYSYSKLNNKNVTFSSQLDLVVTCDFNATEKPMSWVIGQEQNISGNDEMYWGKVLSHQYTNTETMCDIAIDWLNDYFGDKTKSLSINFYGDYAGTHQTSNSSTSDWEIIIKKFSNEVRSVRKFLKPCLSIRDSVAATNAQLCNTAGIRKQFVDYDNCKPLIQDWEKCQWKENNRELQDKDPLRGHACFHPDTLIATKSGEVPISKIKRGDYVLTPKGERQVEGCGITQLDADIYEYIFSDGTKIVCTEDHPFFTADNRQIAVKDLLQSIILVILDPQWKKKLSFMAESDTYDSQNQKAELQDFIMPQVQNVKTKNDCIDKFILIIMEKFQRALIYTTKTIIPLIMNYLILSLKKRKSIIAITGKKILRKIQNYIYTIWTWEGKLIIEGLGQMKIEDDLLSAPKKDGRRFNIKNILAKYVDKYFNQETQGETINIVQINATQNNAEIKNLILKNEIVSDVEKNLRRINIQNKNSVPLHVAHIIGGKYIGKSDVWNMCVEDEHKYFANGFLVSNCRAVDYYNDYENPVRGNRAAKQW